MPSNDRDLSALLPEPPPPRADRRDAAIAAAMRRFDGETPRARGRAPIRPPARWWASLGRPQIGALVTAALVAAVALPVWLSSDHRPASSSRDEIAAAPQRPASVDPSLGQPVAPPIAPAERSPAEASEDVMAEARPNDALEAQPTIPNPQLARTDAPAPAMARREPESAKAEERSEDRLAYAPAPPPPGIVAAPSPPPPPPPPPPPAQALAMEEDASGAGNIVVTGSRVSRSRRRVAEAAARRGDWNACTVDDPDQNLRACGRLAAAGARGPDGRALTLVGEGLSQAWQGDFDRAIATFDRAIALSPRLAVAWLNRGLAHARTGDTDRALADLDRAIRLAPAAARGYYQRSLLLRERGDDRRAAADANRAAERDRRYEVIVE